MIHNIASCDAVMVPRTEINTGSSKSLKKACVCCYVVCGMYGERDKKKKIRGLGLETAKFKTTVRQVTLPPFGNGRILQFIILKNKINKMIYC